MDMSSWPMMLLQVVVFLCILGSTSDRGRYLVTFAVLVFLMGCVIPIALLPLQIPRFCDPKNFKRYVAPAYRFVSRYLFGLRFEVRRKQNIKIPGPAVLIANHQSCLDIFVGAEICSRVDSFTLAMKEELLLAGLASLHWWLSGFIFVKRSNTDKAHYKFNESMRRALQRYKCKILIFPEGTRNRLQASSLLPFKKGPFYCAIKNQVPLVPIVVSPLWFCKGHKWVRGAGNIILEVLPPIKTNGLTLSDLNALVHNTRSLMESSYRKLRKEILCQVTKPRC